MAAHRTEAVSFVIVQEVAGRLRSVEGQKSETLRSGLTLDGLKQCVADALSAMFRIDGKLAKDGYPWFEESLWPAGFWGRDQERRADGLAGHLRQKTRSVINSAAGQFNGLRGGSDVKPGFGELLKGTVKEPGQLIERITGSELPDRDPFIHGFSRA